MYLTFVLIAMFVMFIECELKTHSSDLTLILCFGSDSALIDIPYLKGHHITIGYYPKISSDACGYLSPKDKDNAFKGYAPKTRIINGALAKLGEFPWQATIYHKFRKDSHLCDGVLISERWVLTVRHCMIA